MEKLKSRYAAAVAVVTVGVLGLFAGPAYATTTPDPVVEAEKVLSKFGQKLVDIVTALAANTWVLALFGLGIAFAIARRILSRGERKVSRGVV